MTLHQASAYCGVHGNEFEKNSRQFPVTVVEQQLRLVGYRVTHHYAPMQNIMGLCMQNLEVDIACLFDSMSWLLRNGRGVEFYANKNKVISIS